MFEQVIQFWFEDIEQHQWWGKDDEFDKLIRDRFLSLHQRATQCELFLWRQSAHGRLAEIIILDQFSRNIFRNKPESFSSDNLALALAQEAVAIGADMAVSATMRSFFYMPYMHSESLVIHEQAVDLFSKLENDSQLQFELKHKAIIEKFGRYPHRNAILGRTSTIEELAFLTEPGSRF